MPTNNESKINGPLTSALLQALEGAITVAAGTIRQYQRRQNPFSARWTTSPTTGIQTSRWFCS